ICRAIPEASEITPSRRPPNRQPGIRIERLYRWVMTENDCEAHLSTLEACPQASPWLSQPHGHDGRPQGDRAPPLAGPQAAVRLKRAGALGPDQTIERIVKRQDFLAAAKASSFATMGVVVQMRDRKDGRPARAGFTVTK